MGNFISWFERSYKGIIIVLVAIMAVTLVVLAMQHVSSSRVAANAQPGPIPTFTSSADTKVRAVFLGDSYVAGTGASTPAKRWSSIVADDEGWTEINLGQGATGYVSGGLGEGQQDQYESRIGKVKAADPDVVFVSGSQNDLQFPAAQVATAIRTTLTQIDKAVPDAKIVVLGPVNPGTIVAGTRANDAVVQSVAKELGATYISSIDPGSTYKTQADYFTDGQHPSDSGHQHIADRVEAGLPDEIGTDATVAVVDQRQPNEAMKLLDQPDRTFTISVIGDSTGAIDGNWVGQLGRWMSEKYDRPVQLHQWSVRQDPNGYQPVTTIGDGDNAPIVIWNGSAEGKDIAYSLTNWGDLLPIDAKKVDLAFINHGHNVGAGKLVAEGDKLLTKMSDTMTAASIVVIGQNPQAETGGTLGAAQETNVRAWMSAAKSQGYAVVNVLDVFLDQDDYTTFLLGAVHPTPAGFTLWVKAVEKKLVP